MAAYRIADMNDDIAKFRYDSMQQITKKTELMKTTSPRAFKVKLLTCNVFVFYKNLLCRSHVCSRHNVYNCCKRKRYFNIKVNIFSHVEFNELPVVFLEDGKSHKNM